MRAPPTESHGVPQEGSAPRAFQAELPYLLEKGRCVQLDAGDVLVRARDLLDGLFVLIKGRLVASGSSRQDETSTRRLLEPGAVLGQPNPGLPEPSPLTVRALEAGTVLHLDSHALQTVLGQNLELGVRLLDAAREESRRVLADAPEASRGRLVAVYGPHDGVGRTSAAVAMAAYGGGLELSTLLVDMDPFFGSVGCLADVTPKVDVLSALSPEVTPEDLRDLARTELAFDVLTGPRVLEQGEELMAADGRALAELLTSAYDLVIVDLPSHLPSSALDLLEVADEVHVYLSADLAGLVAGRRALALLDRLEIPEAATRVVLNRYRGAGGLTPEQLREALGRRCEILAEDAGQLLRAANQGHLRDAHQDLALHPLVRVARHNLELALGLVRADLGPAEQIHTVPKKLLPPAEGEDEVEGGPRLPGWALALFLVQTALSGALMSLLAA